MRSRISSEKVLTLNCKINVYLTVGSHSLSVNVAVHHSIREHSKMHLTGGTCSHDIRSQRDLSRPYGYLQLVLAITAASALLGPGGACCIYPENP